ncbi:MAG TPA: patatin-like phospholipase family protein [Nocardioides sp.]
MTTAFVLSGGGSLGAVQVGMLQALAAHGIEPDLLVGTSAGALNAAWVAAHGTSTDSLAGLARVWSGLRRSDVFPVDARTALRGLGGRSAGLFRVDRLQELVTTYAGIDDLEEATIPLHLIAADLASGDTVDLHRGPLAPAVLASAAIPGIFPPVLVGDRHLVDGGVAQDTGVARAVQLGATTVYVLPTGAACALPGPPTSALGTALHALTLLIQRRLAQDVATCPPTTTIKALPPLCPLRTSPVDFTHGTALVDRARRASEEWIDSGAIEASRPERFLANHAHPAGRRPSGRQTPGLRTA